MATEDSSSYTVVIAARWFDRMTGLLVDRPQPCLLVIAPCVSIHTFGMKCCLDIAFFDARGTVLRAVRNVPPKRIIRCKGAYGVLERYAQETQRWFIQGRNVSICIQ